MEDLLSRQYFEEVSESWDDMGTGFFGDAPRKAIHSDLRVPKRGVIADIGSGSGYLLEGLNNREYRLIAVDQSPSMLEKIRRKFGEQVETYEGSSEHLPLKDESVDAIIANMYLHHVERPPHAIREMVRVLRPGGQLIFTDLDKHDYDELITEQYDRWKGFERDQIKSWMEEAGLNEVMIDCVGSDCCTTTQDKGAISINIFIAKGKKA